MKARPPMYVTRACRCCGGPTHVLNGAWLRSVREDEGVTLRAMARRAKVSPAFLSDVERNRRAFSDRLRTAYGLPYPRRVPPHTVGGPASGLGPRRFYRNGGER